MHKVCAITAGIKNYKSIIKKKKKKYDPAVLLAKTKLNSIKILVSEALTDSHISNYQLILVNNVFQEYDDTKE